MQHDEYLLHSPTFNQCDEYFKMCDFKTNHSNIINIDILKYGISEINRIIGLFKLMKFIGPKIADNIEAGIFEFSMIKTTLDGLLPEFVRNVYEDKIESVCANIDINNSRIANMSLKPSLISGNINPYFVAFLSPEQLHPERWKDILNKKASIENRNNNIKVSNIYKCHKCGSRETKTSQMQTRSADEPMTIFVTCLVCFNTFTKHFW